MLAGPNTPLIVSYYCCERHRSSYYSTSERCSYLIMTPPKRAAPLLALAPLVLVASFVSVADGSLGNAAAAAATVSAGRQPVINSVSDGHDRLRSRSSTEFLGQRAVDAMPTMAPSSWKHMCRTASCFDSYTNCCCIERPWRVRQNSLSDANSPPALFVNEAVPGPTRVANPLVS